MFYQGGEIPPCVNYIGVILGKNHYAHTGAYDTSDGLLAHINPQWMRKSFSDLRKSYGGRFLNVFLKTVIYGIQRVARGDCSF